MLADAPSPRGSDADLSIAGTLSERFRQVVAFPPELLEYSSWETRSGRDLFRRTVTSTAFQVTASRITRKSTRPRVADRTMVDTVQPRVLASFGNRSASSLLMKMQLLRWNNAEPTPGPDTRPASSMVAGTGCRGENPRLRRREKNVLDIPSYRTALSLIGRGERAIW